MTRSELIEKLARLMHRVEFKQRNSGWWARNFGANYKTPEQEREEQKQRAR